MIRTVSTLIIAPLFMVFLIGITITAADISSFIREMVPLVTALGVIYGVYTAAKAARTVKETSKTVLAQTADIKETTNTTLSHVDGQATKAQATIEALQKELALMRAIAAENKEIAAKLAMAKELEVAYATVPHAPPAAAQPAADAPTVAVPAVAAPLAATVHLQAIEKHTAETADNTARTDAKVDALDAAKEEKES